MTFKKDMKKAEKIIIDACEKTIRGTALRLFGEIIRVTPVGNPKLWKVNEGNKGKLIKPKGYVGGRLRGNWQATINKPATGTINAPDKSGGRAISKVNKTIKEFDINKAMFLTNNLPYAYRVEYGEWSKQRPQGMVRSTIELFKPEIEAQAARNKK